MSKNKSKKKKGSTGQKRIIPQPNRERENDKIRVKGKRKLERICVSLCNPWTNAHNARVVTLQAEI